MANPNAPHGLNPVGYINGAPWNGKANLYFIPSSDGLAYYIGDIVQSSASADTNGVPGVVRLANGGSGAAVTSRGVIVGIQVSPVGVGAQALTTGNVVNLNLTNIPATKTVNYYVLVADDPNLIFEVMGDNAGTLTLATSINNNASFTQGTPQASDVISRTVLATASITTTNTLPLKILGLPYRPNVDNTANTPLLVAWNTHEFKQNTGSTGV